MPPTAPVATVAGLRTLRRLRSTASSATTTFSAINRSPAYPFAHRLPSATCHTQELCACACSFRLARGGALYTNDHGLLRERRICVTWICENGSGGCGDSFSLRDR